MAWDWKTALKATGVVVVITGGFVVARRVILRREEAEAERQKQLRTANPSKGKRRTYAQRDLGALEGIYDPGRRMHPYVVERLHPDLDRRDVEDRTVNLSPRSQRRAYEYLRKLIFEDNLSEKLSRQELVRRTLQGEVAPDVDWRDGIEIYPVDGAEERIWNGVGEIYDVVWNNYQVRLEDEEEATRAAEDEVESAQEDEGDDGDAHALPELATTHG